MKQFFIVLCALFLISCDPPTETPPNSGETVSSTTTSDTTITTTELDPGPSVE